MNAIVAKIARRRELGYPDAMIADELGKAPNTIAKMAKAAGLARRERDPWTVPAAPLRKLVAAGLPADLIAKRLGKAQRAVDMAMRGLGLHAADEDAPKVAYKRRAVAFVPPAWVPLDDDLFQAVATAFAETGTGYATIADFAAQHGLPIATVQARWHKIAVRA